jgi:mannose-6-phosphate isomerase-like protein (cupin superfamily)
MRIAMLAPITRRIAPETHTSREAYISALTDGLVGKGIDVTLFATGDSQTRARLAAVCPAGCGQDSIAPAESWETLHVVEVLARGEEFDLIHNHCGYQALPLVLSTSTPVLTTLHTSPSLQSLSVYQKVGDRAFYVAANTEVRCPELKLLSTIPWEGDTSGLDQLVPGYLDVYERIMALRRREDHRPWGYYQVLLDEPAQKVKKIVVYPGQRLSLQRHQRRSEHWFVVQGRAVVTRNEEQIPLADGQAVDIPRGAWHRIRNPGTENMAFIEIQTGDYFGEDDIERSEDDYGRAG